YSDEDKNAYLHTVNESIKDVLPDKIKKEINKRLKHLNEYSLNKRLKDIIRNLNDDTITFLFGSRKKGKHFAYRLVNSRNFLAHYDEEGNEYRYKDIELHYASNILEILSTLKLFTE